MTGKTFTQMHDADVLDLLVVSGTPSARTTMPEVGFPAEVRTIPAQRPGECQYIVDTVDANDPRVSYTLALMNYDLEPFAGESDTDRLAGALDHIDRCVKGVFN